MERRFYTLDVFTDIAFGGNPLAVVLDCEGLDDQTMQTIAGEFNLSETVFVYPPAEGQNRASLRIFTPANELPFAGHPTVGTAILLAQLDGVDADKPLNFILEEKAGLVDCQVSRDKSSKDKELTSARFRMPVLPIRQQAKLDRALLAQALGLSVDQLGMAGHENAVCDAGVPFPVVPLADIDALSAITLDGMALEKCMAEIGIAAKIFVYSATDHVNGADYRARMFAPAMGINEDPATGSAVAAFAAQIVASGQTDDGTHSFTIEQGVEMGRPSRITLELEIRGGKILSGHISGTALVITEGKLRF